MNDPIRPSTLKTLHYISRFANSVGGPLSTLDVSKAFKISRRQACWRVQDLKRAGAVTYPYGKPHLAQITAHGITLLGLHEDLGKHVPKVGAPGQHRIEFTQGAVDLATMRAAFDLPNPGDGEGLTPLQAAAKRTVRLSIRFNDPALLDAALTTLALT